MTSQPIWLVSDRGRRLRTNAAKSRSQTVPLRHLMVVIGHDVAEVVATCGGWMSDSALAGWNVAAVVLRGGDSAPLKALGADAVSLNEAVRLIAEGSMPHALVVSAPLVRTNGAARLAVSATVKAELSEVSMWGEPLPIAFAQGSEPAVHHLSSAAAAFKAHALTLAGVACERVDPTESFAVRRHRPRRSRRTAAATNRAWS
jgi:hypothetical protein